jgi:hypothetical protein
MAFAAQLAALVMEVINAVQVDQQSVTACVALPVVWVCLVVEHAATRQMFMKITRVARRVTGAGMVAAISVLQIHFSKMVSVIPMI